MRTLIATLLGSILSLALAVSAAAQNPRISLKLDNVTGTEAMQALGKAAGVSLELPDPRFGGPPLDEELKERASFDWSDTTFARALRQLCARYHLRPGRRPGGPYTLYRDPQAGGPEPKHVGLVEKKAGRAWVRSIRISEDRAINFEGPQDLGSAGNIQISLGGELAEAPGELVAGVRQLSAKDDQGNLLVQHDVLEFMHSAREGGTGGFPDQWSAFTSLPPPHPKATKLLWLEGDLMVYRKYQVHRVEVPMPVREATSQVQAGDIVAEVTRFEPGPPPNPNAPPGFGPGPSLDARLRLPASNGAVRGQPRLSLRGASGKLYDMASGGSGGSGGAQGMTYTFNYTYRRIDEPVTAAVFHITEKSDPDRLFSFRMENIPLPGPPVFIPRRAVARPIPGPGAPGAPERPFLQAGGGVLVHQVQIAGKPAGEGQLSLGLAPKEEDGWGGTRWMDVEVGKDGTARVPEIKPGTYRVLRVFRPKADAGVREDGRWQNAELTVEVKAGAEAVLPPLAWMPAPQAPPAPRTAPAPRKGAVEPAPPRPAPRRR